MLCPVCREPLDLNLDWLAQAKAPSGEKFTYRPTKEMRELQKKMAAMFSRQKDKGAIIDVEAERNKFLISADEVVTVSSSKNLFIITFLRNILQKVFLHIFSMKITPFNKLLSLI